MLLEKNFISPRLQGRTGNIMFQVAHALAKSLEYNRQLVVFKESSASELEHNIFRNIKLLPFNDKVNSIPEISAPFHHTQLEPPPEYSPIRYRGWYQSEKYFFNYSENIRDSFSYTNEFLSKAFNFYPFFIDKTVAAVSVRRGDYLNFPTRHPVVSKEYLEYAYERLPHHDVLLVMSDDPEWCKENLSFENMVISNNNNFWNAEGIWLLSLCDHFIISNSTFSWWGAYLSRSNNKKVIAPQCWFGPDIDSKTSDIYCEGWDVVPSKWENGFIVPVL